MTSASTFRAMGTDAHVVAVGPLDAALTHARRRIAGLERRWSRFLATSEVSTLNRASGRPVVVSADTITLVTRGIEGWKMTSGAFDPTVLDALVASGYDRTFEDLADFEWAPVEAEPAPAPGCVGIRVNRAIRMVMLPAGTAFDPGGLGKGLAADMVVGQLLDEGEVRGACVNLGGDLRAAGEPPADDGWIVSVEDPFHPGAEIARVAIREGAVATTSRTRRRWRRGSTEHHHLIDPGTGLPMDSGLAAVTVVADHGWRAEVLAKAAFLAGADDAARILAHAGATGLLVGDDGRVRTVDGMEAFLV